MATDGRGYYSKNSGSISTNKTTTLATPASTGRVYAYVVGVDVTTAGTTSTATFKDGNGNVLAVFDTTKLGHQSASFVTNDEKYPGYGCDEGFVLEVVTAGGAAATLTAFAIVKVN